MDRSHIINGADTGVDFKHLLDRRITRNKHRERACWLGGIFVTLALITLASWTSQRDEAAIRAERALDLKTKLTAAGCPEKKPGDTDIIVFTIDTSADLHTDKPFKAVHCTRIVERAWFKRQQPKSAIAAR